MRGDPSAADPDPSPVRSSHWPLKSTPGGATALFGTSTGFEAQPERISTSDTATMPILVTFPVPMPAESLSTERSSERYV